MIDHGDAGVCAGCGGPYMFDTSVPSPLWNRVIRGQGHPEYLCLMCIVRAFAIQGVNFTAMLYGAGFSRTPIRVWVNGAEARGGEQRPKEPR